MKNYYDMLSVPAAAPADEIKKAFRREIARYHPDKVQHLGPEFQEMASGIAADLTEAYRILMDPALRARYDEDLKGRSDAEPSHRSGPPPPSAAPPPPPPPSTGAAGPAAAPPPPASSARPTAGFDFVKRASLSKMREAIEDVLVTATALPAPGFDIAVVTKPKKGLFKKAEESVCIAIRFVPFVDAEAVAEALAAGAKIRATSAAGCVVMLLGQGLAPAKDLSAAVSEQRRKLRGGPILVPVDVRDWEALFPPETPGSVRSLIQRLKDEKR